MYDVCDMELFEKFSVSIVRDVDYKVELAEVLNKKYANTYWYKYCVRLVATNRTVSYVSKTNHILIHFPIYSAY